MDIKRFNEIVEEQINTCKAILVKRGKTYAPGEDRIEQEKTISTLRHCTELQAISGMMVKHTITIYDLLEGRIKDAPLEYWSEVIGDHINWLLITKVQIVEIMEENETKEKKTT